MFMKNNIPWNKGKKCPQISESCKGKIPWNYGLNKDIDKRLNYKRPTIFKKGHRPTEEQKAIILSKLKGRIIYWKDKISKTHIEKKEKHPCWKGGISYNKNDYLKNWRHNNGISKKYNSQLGISNTKEYKKLQKQKRKALIKGGGKLTIKIIQLVYEDNIKKYGTLTCYLCEKSIEFGKDNLEHKIPLSRGGTNEYNNLAIACCKCNRKKGIKTENEYRKEFY